MRSQHINPQERSRAGTRISHIDFTDLHHDINVLTAQKALTRAELIILRSRDKGIGITEQERQLLNDISDEIHKLFNLLIDVRGYEGTETILPSPKIE